MLIVLTTSKRHNTQFTNITHYFTYVHWPTFPFKHLNTFKSGLLWKPLLGTATFGLRKAHAVYG